jgi:hypothetical protein
LWNENILSGRYMQRCNNTDIDAQIVYVCVQCHETSRCGVRKKIKSLGGGFTSTLSAFDTLLILHFCSFCPFFSPFRTTYVGGRKKKLSFFYGASLSSSVIVCVRYFCIHDTLHMQPYYAHIGFTSVWRHFFVFFLTKKT